MNPNEYITIQIRTSAGGNFSVGSLSSEDEERITPSHTILQLKEIIAKNENSGYCSVDRQRLIHKGRILNDNHKTLQDYGILESNQSIYLVKSSPRGTKQSQGQQSNTAAAAAAVGGVASRSGSGDVSYSEGLNRRMQDQSNAAANNPFLGMQVPPPSSMEQLLQNPEQLSSLMNSPMMQSLMNNPDFFRNMMESNPQMRQLMDSNPELRHLLDDPELMRRSMEVMRDPSAMQNMMRNQDLAMSQIENIPGGFSALRRMYEDVQEPMMDAMAANGGFSGSSGNGTQNGSMASGGGGGSRTRDNENRGAAGAAMPNPWASSSSTTAPNSRNTVVQSGQSRNHAVDVNNPWATMGGLGNDHLNNGNVNGMGLEQTIQMLENPMIHQMMNSLMSDPATMQSLLQSNPMLRQMLQTNPQVAQMMSNPDFMRTMLDPNNLRSMLQIQNAMQNLGLGHGPGGGLPGSGIPGGVPPPNAGVPPGLDFSTLLNPLQPPPGIRNYGFSSGASSVSGGRGSTAPIPPEQRYRMQLQSLNDMGFDDNVANLAALEQTHGNVNRAIDLLLTSPPTAAASNHVDPDASNDTNNGNEENESKN
jgi:UBA/TS-N domain./Ubiquitin family.